ncbi:MAG TPA: hypothetical protein PK385_13185 [Spirochaetota bacterium]|nr:hypothetical protein [Spirochaetota bacterium]HOS56990.1 hypothetical protein [Spirochaetota bacterium]HPK61733.1 hypothetical protein [Spirochaetota bacterium]HQH31882.1 hypothetical protein [Spirochaetota bacterium]HQJ07038.1 hypothetical protein [Spirochaetota bacterium]
MDNIFEILITYAEGNKSLFILFNERVPVSHKADRRYFIIFKGAISLIAEELSNPKVIDYNRFRIHKDAALLLKKTLLSWYNKPLNPDLIRSNNLIMNISINNESKRDVIIDVDYLKYFFRNNLSYLYPLDDDIIKLEKLVNYKKKIKPEPGASKYSDCLLTHENNFIEISKTGTSDNVMLIKYCNFCDHYFSLHQIDHPYGGYDEWYSPIENSDIIYINNREYDMVNQFSDIMIVKVENSFFLASRTDYYAHRYLHSNIFEH